MLSFTRYTAGTSIPIEQQGGSTTAVVEGHVRCIVLHVRLPGAGDHTRVRVYVVLLLRRIPLNVEDDFLACLQVLGTPLLLEHGCDRGVIDVADVPRGVGCIGAIQRAIRFPGNAEGTPRQTLELALHRRRHIRAVLLDLQLCLNADVFEEALYQLRVVEEVAPIARADRELRLKTLGEPGFRLQALASFWSY